jgi:hypothetical protein
MSKAVASSEGDERERPSISDNVEELLKALRYAHEKGLKKEMAELNLQELLELVALKAAQRIEELGEKCDFCGELVSRHRCTFDADASRSFVRGRVVKISISIEEPIQLGRRARA